MPLENNLQLKTKRYLLRLNQGNDAKRGKAKEKLILGSFS